MNIETYYKLIGLSEVYSKNYCDNNLELIACGSGRCVYTINKDKVIKIAINKFGVFQNFVEGMIYDRNRESETLNRVHKYDTENGNYIIMDKANNITNRLFNDLTKISFTNYKYILKGNKKINNTIINDLVNTIYNEELDISDMTKLNSYGIVNDKIKIIDYGFTEKAKEIFK